MKKLLPLIALGAGAIMLVAGSSKPKSRKKPSGPVKRPELNETGARIYVFEAEWCVFCKKAKPALLETAENHPSIPFQFVDFDSEKELVERFGVNLLPTVISTVDGVETGRIEGQGSVDQYTQMAEDAEGMVSGAIPLPAAPGKKELPPGD